MLLPLVLALLGSTLPIDTVAASAPAALRPRLEAAAAGSADTARLRRALARVVDSLVADGRLLARASADSLVATEEGLRLDVSATTGPRFSWSELAQDGSRTRPEALRRLARWQDGRPADPTLLEASLRRLEATGWMRRTAPAVLVREPRSLRVKALLRLEDLPASSIEAAGGWSSQEEATGTVKAELANLLGTARRLDFGIEKDGNGSRAQAEWTEPWLGPLDVQARIGGQFQGDSLVHATRLWTDLSGSPGRDWLTLSVGLGWWRHAERAPADTAFAPARTETSSRLGARARFGATDDFWPDRHADLSLTTETVHLEDRLGRLRAQARTDASWPLAPSLTGNLRAGARGLWPLDDATPLAEMASPGGIDGWHGWRDGSPWAPSWLWGALEARLGPTDRGGLRAFWEPGLWWVRRPDRQWEPRATWTAGGGVRWRAGTWEIDVLVAGPRDTPSWEEALVHLRARNRF